ncbi:MAG TPA: T9SS type A sorting domain-containing protein [Bacteroidia bacterium]|nr:T9SS type A sorting domain-containing protein [Bacteroidia bacterium]
MIKSLRKILPLLLVLSYGQTHSQSWLWGAQGRGAFKANAGSIGIVSDNAGNAYISGSYTPTIIFDNDTLVANTVEDQFLLVKYNANGKVKWARTSDNMSWGSGEAIDASANIYISGFFADSVRFGTHLLDSAGGTSAFIVKYDSAGNALWAAGSRDIGNSSNAYATAIAQDKLRNSYITGYYTDSVYFENTLIRTWLPQFQYGCFLAKYDVNGSLQWIKTMAGNQTDYNSEAYGYSVTTDAVGSVYVTGYIQDTVYAGPYRVIGNRNQGMFVAKYNSTGVLEWIRNSGLLSYFFNKSQGMSIITDGSKGVYVSGQYADTLVLGTDTLDDGNGFLVKYDTNGNLIWAKGIPDYSLSNGWQGSSLSADANNHIYMGCSGGKDSLVFGSLTIKTSGRFPAAVIKLDTSGIAVCGYSLYNGSESNIAVASDPSGVYTYLTGGLVDSIFCGPDTLLSPNSNVEPYLARWSACKTEEAIYEPASPANNVLLFPNPNAGKFNIQLSKLDGKFMLEIYNVLGEKVYSSTLKPSALNEISLSSQTSGMYLYRVIDEKGQLQGEGKFIIE